MPLYDSRTVLAYVLLALVGGIVIGGGIYLYKTFLKRPPDIYTEHYWDYGKFEPDPSE